jgi:hypothetical protein
MEEDLQEIYRQLRRNSLSLTDVRIRWSEIEQTDIPPGARWHAKELTGSLVHAKNHVWNAMSCLETIMIAREVEIDEDTPPI